MRSRSPGGGESWIYVEKFMREKYAGNGQMDPLCSRCNEKSFCLVYTVRETIRENYLGRLMRETAKWIHCMLAGLRDTVR